MLKLLNNLQLFKVDIEEVITVALGFIVTFNVDLDYICLFHKLLMVAVDMLLKTFLDLLTSLFCLYFFDSLLSPLNA